MLFFLFFFLIPSFKEISCAATQGICNSVNVTPIPFPLYFPSKPTLFNHLISCNQTCEKDFSFKNKTTATKSLVVS